MKDWYLLIQQRKHHCLVILQQMGFLHLVLEHLVLLEKREILLGPVDLFPHLELIDNLHSCLLVSFPEHFSVTMLGVFGVVVAPAEVGYRVLHAVLLPLVFVVKHVPLLLDFHHL